MIRLQVVILAAGKGTRMHSRVPKVAHHVGGRPMLEHVLRAAAAAVGTDTEPSAPADDSDADDHIPLYTVVVGHEREAVVDAVRWSPPGGTMRYVTQQALLGTGDAVRCARPMLEPGRTAPATVLVLYGDTPLVRSETLRALLDAHQRGGATLTFLTALEDRPSDYGRVLRDSAGRVRGVVEMRHATAQELAIGEVNSGIYCFDAAWLWPRLDGLEPHANGERYLTDLIAVAAREGSAIATVRAPLDETLGVNDRVALAAAERIVHDRVVQALMLAGVTIQDPASTYVECGVRVGQDTILRPGTVLRGATAIGARCEIGPHSVISDSRIGDECVVLASWVESAEMAAGAQIGPMSHLRPGARLAPGVKLGNYAEVKNATLGPEVQMHHFSYIGDASVGARTNIAAGTITANFAPDGSKKRTEIGEDVFIGCDTVFVAPVQIGDGAQTGAISLVRHPVPPLGVAVGAPARVIRQRALPAATPPERAPRAGADTGADRDDGERE